MSTQPSKKPRLNRKGEPINQGKKNAKAGKDLEILTYLTIKKFAPSLVPERIDRTLKRGKSLPDIACHGYSELKLDCKRTEGYFGINQLKQLLQITKQKYCDDGDIPLLVVGQLFGKMRLTASNIIVVFNTKWGLTMVPLVDWCRTIERKAQNV